MPQTQDTMTEQEAEVFAARLERVWGLANDERTVWKFAEKGHIHLKGDIEFDGEKAIFEIKTWQGTCFRIFNRRGDNSLRYSQNEISYFVLGRTRKPTPFIVRWMPLFRRNCWLSGLEVDCTFSEACEWMQVLPSDAAYVVESEFEKGERWTAHEKLELRLSMPREFWPKTWLDE